MVIKRTIGEKIFDSFNVVFMVILAVMFLYPLLYCLAASLSDPQRLQAHVGPLAWPLGFTLGAYKQVLSDYKILRGIINTVFYVVAGTTINIFLTSFAAYALSRKGYYWKKPIMYLIVLTMYFGGGLIPFYMLVNSLGIADTPFAVILPSAINTFYMIIMRTYFLSIPVSMEESARIDGAQDFTILFKIMLPLAMPVVAVMIIYYGVGHWNNWFYAMIFLNNNQNWIPLQLILRNILIFNNAQRLTGNMDSIAATQDFSRLIQFALIIVTVLPIAMIYPFMQKHFIKGVMIGSIKE